MPNVIRGDYVNVSATPDVTLALDNALPERERAFRECRRSSRRGTGSGHHDFGCRYRTWNDAPGGPLVERAEWRRDADCAIKTQMVLLTVLAVIAVVVLVASADTQPGRHRSIHALALSSAFRSGLY